MFYKFVTAWGSDKSISAWCDFSFVSKLTGDAGNYPFLCAGTKIKIVNSIQKLSLTLINITSQHWKASTFYKGTLSLSLDTFISGKKISYSDKTACTS